VVIVDEAVDIVKACLAWSCDCCQAFAIRRVCRSLRSLCAGLCWLIHRRPLGFRVGRR